MEKYAKAQMEVIEFENEDVKRAKHPSRRFARCSLFYHSRSGIAFRIPAPAGQSAQCP